MYDISVHYCTESKNQMNVYASYNSFLNYNVVTSNR